MSTFKDSTYMKELLDYQLPRYHEIPTIHLYMDQVLSLLHTYLDILEVNENEKFITSNMINNYVKQKILPKPIKKKYTREHIVFLIIICLLKQILSIQEIKDLVSTLKFTSNIEETYNYFCHQLERTIKDTFTTGPRQQQEEIIDDGIKIMQVVALAFSNKIYIQKKLQFMKEKEVK